MGRAKDLSAPLCTGVLINPQPDRNETSYSDRRVSYSYIPFIITIGGILVLYIYIYITRLASKEIFSPSKKYIEKKVRLRTYQHPLILKVPTNIESSVYISAVPENYYFLFIVIF